MAEQERSNKLPIHSNIFQANTRIARNSIFLSIRMVIVLCINLYATRAVLDLLGVEDYGIYNVVCGFVSMFTFLNTSLSNGIQRFYNFELGKNGLEGACRVFNTARVIQIGLIVIVVLIAETIGLWYIHNKMVIPDSRFAATLWIYQYAIVSFVFVIMQAPYTAAVMAHERMDFFAIVSVLDAVLKLAVIFIIPILGGDYLIVYGLCLAIISLFDFFCYLIYSKINFKEIKYEKHFDKQLFRSMLGFSGWNIFGSFAGVIKEQGINLIFNWFFGPVVNAARGVAMQVNSGLQGFVSTITTPVRPQVIQSYAQGNVDRTMNLTYSISKLSCMFLYLMALPVTYEIDFILRLWLGPNVPDHTSTFVTIIILISFVNNLNGAVSGVVHASGKMKLYQLSTSFTSFLCIPLSYVMLKFGFDPEWALWMVFATMVITQIVALFVLKTIVSFKIADYLKRTIAPIFLVLISTLWVPSLIHFSMEECWLRFVLVVIFSLVTVALSVYLVGLSKPERVLVNNMIKNKLNK